MEQNPPEVTRFLGQNISISCRTLSDRGDKISNCVTSWFIKRNVWKEVSKWAPFQERFLKTKSTLVLNGLELNDTDTYYCNMQCHINDRRRQYHGNGTRVNVFALRPTLKPATGRLFYFRKLLYSNFYSLCIAKSELPLQSFLA